MDVVSDAQNVDGSICLRPDIIRSSVPIVPKTNMHTSHGVGSGRYRQSLLEIAFESHGLVCKTCAWRGRGLGRPLTLLQAVIKFQFLETGIRC